MQWTRSFSFAVVPLLLGAVLLSGGRAWSGNVSVEQPHCGAEVTLVADEARLSEVLTEMAAKLGFALRFDRDSDRTLSFEATRAPDELIESLTRGDNVMITTQDDPDCAGQRRITDVRFLAAGDPIVVPAHVPANAPPMRQAKPAGSKRAQLEDANKLPVKRRHELSQERQIDPQQRQRDKRR